MANSDFSGTLSRVAIPMNREAFELLNEALLDVQEHLQGQGLRESLAREKAARILRIDLPAWRAAWREFRRADRKEAADYADFKRRIEAFAAGWPARSIA